MSEENKVWRKLQVFNDRNEDIIYIFRHNSGLFIITYTQKLSLYGILSGFELKGYLLEDYMEDFINGRAVVRLQGTVCYDKEYKYLKSIFIQDFIVDENSQNCGYGSIMMNQLIQLAEDLNVKYISGELSYVDIGKNDNDEKSENRKMIYHFYEKHGFTITEDKKIIYILNKIP